MIKLPTIIACLSSCCALHLVRSGSQDAMLVAAATYASLATQFSIAIIVVEIGALLACWVFFHLFYVDIQAITISEDLAIEVWSHNADSNTSAWQTFCSRDLTFPAIVNRSAWWHIHWLIWSKCLLLFFYIHIYLSFYGKGTCLMCFH